VFSFSKQSINEGCIDYVDNILQADFLTQSPQVSLFEKKL